MDYKRFALSDNFLDGYKRKREPLGFNGLGKLVYMRTYSRNQEDGTSCREGKRVRHPEAPGRSARKAPRTQRRNHVA